MRVITELLKDFPESGLLPPELLKRPVTTVTADSKEVVPGSIFVAIRGERRDGHAFLFEASQRGACVLIGEAPVSPEAISAPYLRVSDSRAALATLAAAFYEYPSHSMKVVGVTGTSGKTTSTYLIESILTAVGEKVGVVGTVNFRFGSRILPSTHTTPGPMELQKLLSEMKSLGCTAVVMEVSSHGLAQKRSADIAFDGMIFTNLSLDHLDFHKDMEDYFQAKTILFRECARYSVHAGKRPVSVSNGDTDWGRRMLQMAIPELDSSSFGLGRDCEFSGSGLNMDLSGIRGSVRGEKGEIAVQSSLIGQFNAYNILGTLALAEKMGVSSYGIAQGIASLKGVPGRMESVSNNRGLYVFVDYAHKPGALENVLSTLAEMQTDRKIITVFGCGGDRDQTKRPVMGEIASRFSDHVIVTSDNPRSEDPNHIIAQIVAGMPRPEQYTVISDRKKAIFAGIAMAQKGDVVLIAGKGHEDYQIIGTQKIHFDDREIAQEALDFHHN